MGVLRLRRQFSAFCAINSTVVASVMVAALSSCVHVLVEDRTISPLEAGAGRVETVVCGGRSVGDNLCWIKDGQEAEIVVVTAFDGVVTAKSDECGIDLRRSYVDFQPVSIRIQHRKSDDLCVIDLFVVPTYPVKDSAVKVSGSRGRVIIGFLGGTSLASRVSAPDAILAVMGGIGWSFPEGKQLSGEALRLSFPTKFAGVIRLDGCGLGPFDFEQKERSEDVSISYDDLSSLFIDKRHCVLYGAAIDKKSPVNHVFVIAVEVYDRRYVKLSEPSVTFDRGRVSVASSDPVSFTVVDGEVFRGADAEKRRDVWPVFVRQYSANGRSFVGRYDQDIMSWGR